MQVRSGVGIAFVSSCRMQPSIRLHRAAASSAFLFTAHLSQLPPHVNVYLCIKQALFIRAMNMHCLVAVARCRVQTRRYHCLINHIQSQRPTLRTPLSLHSILCVLCSPLSSPSLSRGPAEDPPCHPSKLYNAFPLVVFLSLPLHTPPISAIHSLCLPPAGRN